MAICDCGRRKRKMFAECDSCQAKRNEGYQTLVDETNALLKNAIVIRDTAFGPYVVKHVRYSSLGSTMITYPVGRCVDDLNRRTFMIDMGEVRDIHDRAAQASTESA